MRPASSTSEDGVLTSQLSSVVLTEASLKVLRNPFRPYIRDIVMILTKKTRHILFLMIMTPV